MKEEKIDKKLAEFRSNSGFTNKKFHIPVSIALQEASDQYVWCKKDKILLIKGTLDWNIVEDLPIRIGALEKTQALGINALFKYRCSLKEYKAETSVALKLQKEINHYLNFADSRYPEAFSKLAKVKPTSGKLLIKTLDNMVNMGNQKKKELATIGFDQNLLLKAKTLSLKLKELQRTANKILKEYKDDLRLRNKAYFHLKEAVDEIRRVGKYVFWQDEERRAGYVSHFLQKNNKKANKRKI